MDSLAIFVDVGSWLVRQEPWRIAVSALLLISAVAAAVLSVRFFMKAICEARVLRVERGSERLLLARQLYGRYESALDRVSPHLVRYVSCKSKGQFDRFDGFRAQQTLVEYVSLHEKEVLHRFDIVKNNHIIYRNYLNEFDSLPSASFRGGLGQIEATLCGRSILEPAQNLTMDVYVTYCSPAGRRTYSKKFSMDEKAIADAISQSHRIVSEQEARKRERAKVTQKLRHKVLERDHYRCVHCGASAIDGAKLHVDHIIPIAHGGKTELDNLQTLCEACNLGKGSDLPMDGAGSTG